MPTPAALGLAMALPHRKVIALDGDGSILLDLAAVPTVGDVQPKNLTVVVFDNEAYESNGALPTVTSTGTDLTGIAIVGDRERGHGRRGGRLRGGGEDRPDDRRPAFHHR